MPLDRALAISGPNIYTAPARLCEKSFSLRPLCLSPSTIVDFAFDILRHTTSPPYPSPIDSTVCWSAREFGFGKRVAISSFGHKRNMFKISIVDKRSRRTLVVEGMLVGPWVAELRKSWSNASQELSGRKLVIDLSSLTVISREGEDAIFDLMKKGVTFSCWGVLTKHVLKQLARKTRQESPRR